MQEKWKNIDINCLFVYYIVTATKKIYLFRQGTAKFSPQNINPYLCTHLIYAFAGLGKDDEIQTFDKYQDLEKGKVSWWFVRMITVYIPSPILRDPYVT